MTTFTEVAGAFRELRMRHGLSQFRFAQLIHCDHTYISRIESGQRVPSREFIEQMGEHFDLPQRDIDTLLAAAGYLPPHLERYVGEPDVIVALDALRDPAVPEAARDLIRQALRVAGDAGRLVKREQAA